jgi:hypothetical protein
MDLVSNPGRLGVQRESVMYPEMFNEGQFVEGKA